MNPTHHPHKLDSGKSNIHTGDIVSIDDDVQLVNVADLDSEVDAFAEEAFVRLQSNFIAHPSAELPLPPVPRGATRPSGFELRPPASSRDILDLREALNKKDRDILALRETLTQRDRELVEAAERSLVLERAHADAEDRAIAAQEQLAGQLTELRAKLDVAIRTAARATAKWETDRAALEKAKEALLTVLAQIENVGAPTIDA